MHHQLVIVLCCCCACWFVYVFVLFGQGLIVAHNDFKLSLWPMMASLEFLILLPLSPKSWDYSCELASLV